MMQIVQPAFQKYLFVCEHERSEGDFCGAAGMRIRERLKDTVKRMGLASKVRVSRTGCLDVCAEGPSVLLMPDNLWFKRVSEDDIEVILRKACEGLT